jgi:hypothetical protein
VSKRSRRARVLTSGDIGWRVGFGPGEPHWPGDIDPLDEGPSGGVREPRRPAPTLPGMSEHMPLPEPPIHAEARFAATSG